jgi:hypothetical protein
MLSARSSPIGVPVSPRRSLENGSSSRERQSGMFAGTGQRTIADIAA